MTTTTEVEKDNLPRLQMYSQIIQNKEQNQTTVVLCTDMSAAYDTVDHEILLKKLTHYGIRGKSNNIINDKALILYIIK